MIEVPEEEWERGMENVFDEIIAENYKSEEGNRYSSIRRTEGTREPKQTHTKTWHI